MREEGVAELRRLVDADLGIGHCHTVGPEVVLSR